MKKLIRTFKQILILIFAVTFLGCEDDDANLPRVLAGFTYTINADTGVVTFINLSTNATNYNWDFGDGKSSSLINPVKAYQNGTYTVLLTASVLAGASDTFEDEITILIPEIATLPITFDGANTKYEPTVFEGASFEVVDNPAPGGTNNVASKVGAITNSGATFEGLFFELGTAIDLATERTIKMNFWADAAVDVLLKLEEGSSSTPDVVVSHNGSGWEELSFNFTATSTYSKLVIFVDGPGTTAGTFYMDDIMQIETPAPPCTPETEQSLEVADFNLTFQTEGTTSTITDDGSVMTRILNPDTDNDVNKSCYVGQIVRSPDAEFANNQIEFDTKLDFNANAGFKLKVWSATAGTNIQLKIEDKSLGNAGPFAIVDKVTTVANAWEELTFDFASGDSGKFDRIVLFFEVGQNVPGTYYIDDFMLYGTGSGGGGDCVAETGQSFAAADLNITFATDPGSTETVGTTETLFLGDVGYVYADNPDATSSINSSCKVAEISKGAENYPNVQIFTANKYNFTDNAGFKLKIYSPNVGTNVLLKLEDTSNGATFNQVSQLTSVANEWEELTFDFPEADTNKFDRIIIFFGFEQPAALTVSFDDLKLYPRSGGGGSVDGNITVNGDFETGDTTGYTIFDAQGGVFTVTNEEAQAGTFSGKLTAGEGTEIVIKQANLNTSPAIGTGVSVTISFDLKGSLAGAGGVVFAEFFSEINPEGVSKAEILSGGPLAPTDTWTNYSFTTTTGNDVSGGVTLQLKAACGAVSGCGVIAYFDNVSVTINP
tara:strand:+ start:720 stop:3041 length:2322 start_codon:yes stop_codon:yes gene_type:complete